MPACGHVSQPPANHNHTLGVLGLTFPAIICVTMLLQVFTNMENNYDMVMEIGIALMQLPGRPRQTACPLNILIYCART